MQILTDQEFLYRNSPIGDGTGTITKIKGNSLVFNQLVYLINYSGTVSQIAITQNRSDGRFIATGTASGSFNQNLATHISVVKDHIYLLTSFHQVRPVVSGSGQISLQIYSPSNSAAFQYNIFERDTNNYIFIKSSVTANDVVLRNRFQSGNTYSIDYYPQLFDLSQIFGQTIANQVYTMEQTESGSGLAYFNENFKDYYPLDYYECSSKNLLSFDVPYRPSNISSMTFDVTKAVRVHNGTSYEWSFDSFTNATSWRVALTCFDTNGNRIYTGSDISSVSGLTSLPANASSSYYLNGSNNTSLAHGFVSNFDGYIMPFFMLGDTSASSVMNNANIHSLNSGDFNILLSFNGTDLKTQSEDESQSDTLTLPISTYFPTGMKSAGDVYDELTPSKAYTRIGSYTFTGNENFSSQSVGRVYMTTYIPIQAPSNRSTPANIICNNFTTIDDNHIESNSGQISFWNGQIGFCLEKSTSSGSVADLKAYLQSHTTTIYYEMVDANKTEQDISPELDLSFTTYRNGTEQILPVNTSIPTIAPIICDIEYRGYVSVITSTNPSGVGSVWQSADIITEGGSVSVRARDEAGYRFSHWSNGDTTNPTTISNIQSDITITAYYTLLANDSINHQFRAYIKDKMAINTLPKAFIDVESFVIRRDLLTSTKSEINAYEMPTNINEGDIIVVYDSKGHVLYHGVIDQISDTKLNCNQIQNFYEGTWVCDNYPTTSIEAEISYLLGQYANGYQKDSTWQDQLIYQELAPLKITTGSTTVGYLESFEANTTMDFEEFIYSLYSKYNLVFDFTIPYNSWNIGDNDGKVEIRKPSQTTILIGDNTDVIQNISPTTEIEQTNKLIVYASDGTYRTTYVYKSGSGIVIEPNTQIGRLAKVNTAVVFSDDLLDDIKEANITAEMFNHKVTFDIEEKNNLYDFWSWELGQPIKIWQGNNYFDSVFTGYEITCNNGEEIGLIKVICGKVRTKLTSLLKMGVAK